MPLTSFGSILGFAEDLENGDTEFYKSIAASPDCADIAPLVEPFINELKKNIALIQRTRRENVTEMILEPIHGFERSSFVINDRSTDGMDKAKAKEAVNRLEERAVDYYTQAAGKIKALPEVAVAMKQLAKKHKARLGKVSDF